MTNMNLLQAMGHIDPKLISDSAPDVPQKKNANITLVKWASLAACFSFAIITALVGGQSNGISSLAVINYGPFIFFPVLIVSFILLCISLVRKETPLISSLITSVISLVVVNILNVLGAYLYSQLGEINILGNLPIILISSNAGAIISIVTITLLGKKIRTWWIKLLFWLFIFVVSIIVSVLAHNLIFTLLTGDSITQYVE